MDPGEVPAFLPQLSQLEEIVIARAHVQIVVKRYQGHQYRYSGHCVTFLQNIVKTVSVLPNLPEELDILILRPSNIATDDRQFRRQFLQDFRVHRAAILTWLQFLKANHPDYRYINISTDRLNALPLDGDVSDLITTIDEDTDVTDLTTTEPSEHDLPPLNSNSMVLNTNSDSTEQDQIFEELTGCKQTVPGSLLAPSIRMTPIDKASSIQRIFAIAFPTLYPIGRADFNTPQQHTVTLKAYIQHLLRFTDGRFGSYARWRFLTFNILIRQKAGTAARYYVLKTSELHDLDYNELRTALKTNDALLPQIVRQGSSLLGTRPFWKNKSNSLYTQARFLTLLISPVFITFSYADMQQNDLQRHLLHYEEYLTAPDYTRRHIVWQNVQDQPYIIAAYLDLQFRTYLRTVLCPYLQYDDFWQRYEWQARSSSYIHALFWVPSAPPLDQSTDASWSVFIKYWGERITAWNPDPLQLPDDRNPASLLHINVTNTSDQFAAFLN